MKQSNLLAQQKMETQTIHLSSYVVDLWDKPQIAQEEAKRGIDILETFTRVLTSLQTVAERNSKAYGKASELDSDQLLSMNSTGNTLIAAVFAFASSLKSIGQKYNADAQLLSQILNGLNPLLKEHMQSVQHIISDHLMIQQEAENYQQESPKKPGGVTEEMLQKKLQAIEKSLTQTLSALHGMEVHRRTVLSDALIQYTSKHKGMIDQVEEIIQTLKLIHTSVDLSSDFKREIAAVLEVLRLEISNEESPDIENLLRILAESFVTENAWSEASTIIQTVDHITDNTATGCNTAQKIFQGIKEACDQQSKMLEKTLSSIPKFLHDADLSPYCLKQQMPKEMIALMEIILSLREKHNSNQMMSRSLKVSSAQLGIILEAHTEAKSHLSDQFNSIAGELSEKKAIKENTLAELNRLIASTRKAEKILDKSKIQSTDESKGNVDDSGDSSSPGKTFAARFQEKVFSRKDKVSEAISKISKLESERSTVEEKLYAANASYQEVKKDSFKRFSNLVTKFMRAHYEMNKKIKDVVYKMILEIENETSRLFAGHRRFVNTILSISPLQDVLSSLVLATAKDGMFSIIEELESGDESQPTSLSKNMKKQTFTQLISITQINESIVSAKDVRFKKKQEEIHIKFKLPTSESVIASYSCAFLPQKVPFQGRIYLTHSFLCFAPLTSVFGSTKLVLRYSDIVEIKKAKSAWGLMANSLVVVLADDFRLYFTSFFNRDKCYKQIIEQSKNIIKVKAKVKRTISRDRTLSEPATSLSITETVMESISVETKSERKNEEAWREFDPRRLGLVSSSNERVSSTGFLRLSASSTNLNTLRTRQEKRKRPVPLPKSPDLSEWEECEDLDWVHENVEKAIHYIPCTLDYLTTLLVKNGKDLWQELGETSGEYGFVASKWHEKPIANADSKEDGELVSRFENSMLERSLEFKRPLGNATFSNSVAHAMQIQCAYGCNETEDRGPVHDGGDALIFTVKNVLKGFIYAECFQTKVYWSFSKMKNKNKCQKQPWTKAVVSTKVIFLKPISISYVKRRIVSENRSTVETIADRVVANIRNKISPDEGKLSSRKVGLVRSISDSVVAPLVPFATNIVRKLFARLKSDFNLWILESK